MISYIKGDVKAINEEGFIIETNNIGYYINSTLTSLSNIQINNEYKIYTSMQVREDDISLYGFYSKDELEMFLLLISVSSIGPKIAIGMLSSISADEIKLAIVNNDIDKLTDAKGIGKKTASRIILELVDKVKKMAIPDLDKVEKVNPVKNNDIEVAREALKNLGYMENDVARVLNELKDTDLSLEGLIKESLKRLI
ncbi:Holliday junction branch migration protein RuvA [Anaerococcus lactolyticus]|uniref:Holliday junction branch migration complex subunit RuvA n=2 Tax=Anaerococcus lactolyticus TaxID=33032 RepID=C2BDC5_9FIRM|nr:Holliday junction branch migration protein RuvA [Anaerococcus lactolyticus]EEI87112.1 Holliday junction DNA helicase RuvA [Anaerococcus lactolyticus ATCC 51172]KGF03121.1 ATP-dependent DNA helicase RuvA [Anaerococcus lactolyticus S7-1-13]